jgi:hypothetical protein
MTPITFDKTTAKRIVQRYHGSFHEVWRDLQGHKMLGCASRRSDYPGVSVNLAALDQFREEGGKFVGLKNVHFSIIVPIEKLDSIRRWDGDDFIVVRPSDIGLEVAVEDTTPCAF